MMKYRLSSLLVVLWCFSILTTITAHNIGFAIINNSDRTLQFSGHYIKPRCRAYFDHSIKRGEILVLKNGFKYPVIKSLTELKPATAPDDIPANVSCYVVENAHT